MNKAKRNKRNQKNNKKSLNIKGILISKLDKLFRKVKEYGLYLNLTPFLIINEAISKEMIENLENVIENVNLNEIDAIIVGHRAKFDIKPEQKKTYIIGENEFILVPTNPTSIEEQKIINTLSEKNYDIVFTCLYRISETTNSSVGYINLKA